MSRVPYLSLYCLVSMLALSIVLTAKAGAQESIKVDFEKDIAPILVKRCMRCHEGDDAKDGIDLSVPEFVIDSYVFAGDPDESDFYYRMVTDDEGLLMPPPDDGGPMPREEALLVRLWIAEGAEWPEDFVLPRPSLTDEGEGSATETGIAAGLTIDFEKDVKPIIEEHCISCHGSESPAEGISFATRADVLGNYVFPHEPDSSSLYTRLITEDQGKLMPPPSEGGALSPSEILIVKLWIAEGSNWPESVELGEPVEVVAQDDRPFLVRFWSFQGFFHPAAVHFPVALISIAAVFVLLHWIFGGGFRDAAVYCLVFGALSSVVASAMGWALSPMAGFGDAPMDASNSAFWHRWCGILVTVFSIFVAILALRARKADRDNLAKRTKKELPWQLGTFLLAALVGLTGHQGGELSYGEAWYENAFAQLGLESGDDGNEDEPAVVEDEEAEQTGSASDEDQDSDESGSTSEGEPTSTADTDTTESSETETDSTDEGE